MKLQNYTYLKATLRLKSGQHSGTGEKDVPRGEPQPIIKSTRTLLPYIPGSSLKGKMRCLFEVKYGRKQTDPRDSGSPCWCGKCQICLLFGSGNAKTTFEPTRLIFRDCYLKEEYAKLLEDEKIKLENKPGVRIDRNTGKAAERALFPMERIPEGCEFNFEISIRVFENDDKKALEKWLTSGLFLLEQDAIGGGGTRGSGWVVFEDVEFDGQKLDDKWREQVKENINKLTDIKIR